MSYRYSTPQIKQVCNVQQAKRIAKLLDSMEEVIVHPDNKKRQNKWLSDLGTTKDTGTVSLSGIPSSEETPCTLFLGLSYWHKKIGLDVRRYYTDPYYYLEYQLKMCQERLYNYHDDTFFTGTMPLDFGVAFVPSLFDAKTVFLKDKDPWVRRGVPSINKMSDVEQLPFPDFYSSRQMKWYHAFYERIEEIVSINNHFQVKFPDWRIGPFPLALGLRGWNRLLEDTADNEDLVHALMEKTTGYRIKWCKQRARHTGESENTALGNDDINHPVVSAQLYSKYILPYEKNICRLQNRISYWHSCGNITPLLDQIAQIPQIDLLQVSPFSDLRKVAKTFSKRQTALQIWIHPARDLILATPEHMRRTLEKIVRICHEENITRYSIVSGHIQPMMDLAVQEKQIQLWLSTVRQVLDTNRPSLN